MTTPRRPERGALAAAAGWLFADLLLALSVVFLVANSVGYIRIPAPNCTLQTTPTIVVVNTPIPVCTPPPTATATPVTPMPVVPQLQLQPVSKYFTFDIVGLAAGNALAKQGVQQQVIAWLLTVGNGHRAGLILVYGGIPTATQGGETDALTADVIAALQALRSDPTTPLYEKVYHSPLYETVYHSPLRQWIGSPQASFYFEAYLFVNV